MPNHENTISVFNKNKEKKNVLCLELKDGMANTKTPPLG